MEQMQQTGNSIPQSNQPTQTVQVAQAGTQPVKKSKWWLWVAIGVIVIGVLVYFLFF